eukprot:CAMPEP_0201510780 /NCGR_PEP_ID=MMETSP0161_2-20130828/3348_1 /ASSEMBLY_ACC=CAM_ASM_000251 /TAXON_ID=180227 /ORGANISM="Neoparamoeba aestuarina, Strain SoJaBio B1-5/56/2" /LENGTH=70 /DNA_ID=CAMNT_0047906017 /DNA_START=551 /DNA_END=760 /DNA_ORIENTATION=-
MAVGSYSVSSTQMLSFLLTIGRGGLIDVLEALGDKSIKCAIWGKKKQGDRDENEKKKEIDTNEDKEDGDW